MDKKNKASIKAWVTRQTAFSIQCGGLDRLTIHFSKPIYVFEKYTEQDRDTPFGDISEAEGLYKRHGWYELEKKCYMSSLSVRQWLGYESPISVYIWEKLREHFNNKPFDDWHELEKSGECKVEDFCLELNLEISIV